MDVHPTKNVSIGIDPYPYLTYLDYVMDYHPLWESGKKSNPEGPESMNVYQHLHHKTPRFVKHLHGAYGNPYFRLWQALGFLKRCEGHPHR